MSENISKQDLNKEPIMKISDDVKPINLNVFDDLDKLLSTMEYIIIAHPKLLKYEIKDYIFGMLLWIKKSKSRSHT
ncbi:hypothetical protein HQ529_02440 [Candidatus Woesearchaeota archaeon]|nr:hypothetical protein [Candidatus Woesearchaeota archaeon]